MGLPQKNEPNVGPPAPAHAGQDPPLQHPQDEAPQQYPPASVPYSAEPSSPCPFPPQQQHPPYQQPQTAAFHPFPPQQQHPLHQQPQAAAFHPFPPQQQHPLHQQPQAAAFHPPPQPAVPFPPCYPPPATNPPYAPQQSNQAATPVHGVPSQNPYAPKPPPPYGPGPQYSANWTTGLFDCLEDPNSALITFCFPCVTFGQVAEILDHGQTSCTTSAMMYSLMAFAFGVPWILSCTYRTKLRTMYGLPESPAPDLIVHCFCDSCAICQEYRELRNRGLDPALGWQGNMMLQAQQQQATMAPPVNQTMNM